MYEEFICEKVGRNITVQNVPIGFLFLNIFIVLKHFVFGSIKKVGSQLSGKKGPIVVKNPL